MIQKFSLALEPYLPGIACHCVSSCIIILESVRSTMCERSLLKTTFGEWGYPSVLRISSTWLFDGR